MALIFKLGVSIFNRPLYQFSSGRDKSERSVIATALRGAGDAIENAIYERRVLTETAIFPVLKAFKAMIRAEGLFAEFGETEDELD